MLRYVVVMFSIPSRNADADGTQRNLKNSYIKRDWCDTAIETVNAPFQKRIPLNAETLEHYIIQKAYD